MENLSNGVRIELGDVMFSQVINQIGVCSTEELLDLVNTLYNKLPIEWQNILFEEFGYLTNNNREIFDKEFAEIYFTFSKKWHKDLGIPAKYNMYKKSLLNTLVITPMLDDLDAPPAEILQIRINN